MVSILSAKTKLQISKTKDPIAREYTIGEQFNPILNPEKTLVSQFSLNFGFGSFKRSDILSN